MNKEHFHLLRRGDLVYDTTTGEKIKLDMFRVCHKAKFDVKRKLLLIRITNVFIPTLVEFITEDKLNDYDLIPFTKNKYGIKD